MSLNRADYQKLIEYARYLDATGIDIEDNHLCTIAHEIFTMCEQVIGQQMPPLDSIP